VSDLRLTAEGRQPMVSTNEELEVEHSGLEVSNCGSGGGPASSFPARHVLDSELSEAATTRPAGQTECEGGFQ
jgi:hypothetical protein